MNEAPLTIKVKYLEPDLYPMEKHGDWIDLRAAETVTLKPFQSAKIRLGVAMELPEGYEAFLLPRSSTFDKWHVIQTNSMGLFDEEFCGDHDEWRYPVLALEDTTIYKGDRICQFRIIEHQPKNTTFEKVKTLGNKDRGGFGSSGSN